jgi:hypothetical protein
MCTVTPIHCWLVQASETKAARTYTYIKLLSEQPGKKLTSKSLGKLDSPKYCTRQEAIDRREHIAELEQPLKILEDLMERQQKLH